MFQKIVVTSSFYDWFTGSISICLENDSCIILKFAENVIKIYENDDLRESLIEEGRKAVNEKFNVKRVVKEHQRLFEKI